MENIARHSKLFLVKKSCPRKFVLPIKHFCTRQSNGYLTTFGGRKTRYPDFLAEGRINSCMRFSLPFSTVAKDDSNQSSLTKQTFVYTDYSKIEDEKKQGCYLTKSVLKPGLPPIFDYPLDLDEATLKQIYSEFENELIDSFLFCYGKEKEQRKKYSVVNAFLNMMQTTWRKTTNRYSANLSRSLFYKQHVTATFNRCNKFNVQIAGKPQKSFLMMSKDPLKQFATDEEVSKSVESTVQWDEVFDPIFNFRVSMVNEKIASPFISGAPFPNPHTLFITADKDNVEMKRLIGHGILYSFAHAFVHALSQPQNRLGMKEIEPISVQCVISDGRVLTFVCHQLNTLDFENDDGIKNFIWLDDNIEMFKYAYMKVPGDRRYKDITETTIYLEDVNQLAFEKFLKFVLN